MLKVLSRMELGYSDEFEGFMFFKGHEPAAQLHLYDNFYTLFWRGQGVIASLGESLGGAVEKICEEAGRPFEGMSRGEAKYVLADDVLYETFELFRDRWGRWGVRFGADPPRLAPGGSPSPPSFIRFDVEGDLDVPVILWADLIPSEDAEVGFSTTVEPPRPILQLLQHTCRVELSDPDIEELERVVREQILVRAHA